MDARVTKITADGMLIAAGVLNARRPPIEKGPMKHVRGIIVHQSDSSTAQATLNSYLHAGNGAHFLIDKDGTIYQTASLLKKTWHVGKLKAKCFETHTCSAAEVKIGPTKHSAIYRIEMRKSVPNRFPSNEDSIGIELVGRCILDPKLINEGMSTEQIERLRADKGVYETVTPAQNLALGRLISELQTVLIIPVDEVYPHPRVSAKNATEASTAQWAGRK
jgi:N-acetyl-anhydromuramyl-L-alanine amidase AmpD